MAIVRQSFKGANITLETFKNNRIISKQIGIRVSIAPQDKLLKKLLKRARIMSSGTFQFFSQKKKLELEKSIADKLNIKGINLTARYFGRTADQNPIEVEASIQNKECDGLGGRLRHHVTGLFVTINSDGSLGGGGGAPSLPLPLTRVAGSVTVRVGNDQVTLRIP